MLDKARAVGNNVSQASAAAFLRSWRQHGTPFTADHARSSTGVPGRQSVLLSAWTLCDRYERELDIIHIKYRWAMAFLGQTYADRMDQIRRADSASSNDTTRNRYGKGKVSLEAIEALLPLINRTLSGEPAKTLDWGILCLMPHDVISNSWVENDLVHRLWHLWLELVGRVNPGAWEASKALDAWLGSEGITGGSISSKEPFYIEAGTLLVTQVKEIENSDDSEGSSRTSINLTVQLSSISAMCTSLFPFLHSITGLLA